MPLFVRPGSGVRQEIASMPGNFQFSPELLAEEIRALRGPGSGRRDSLRNPRREGRPGSDSTSPEGIIARAVRLAKQAAPEMLIMTDVCLCEYTDHGHCGPLNEMAGRMEVDNDATLEILARQAVVHAQAGADLVAPSGMMDGMVAAIRRGLDGAGFTHIPIMSYAAKYASAFYGPFRDAAESAPKSGDRRSYQMDAASSPGQALREIELDLAEGADMIMVKPALAYLDIIRLAADHFPGVPLAAYNVSGEFSMVKAAAAKGWIDQRAVVLETLTAIQRAGASIVLTYWAKDAAGWLG